jgi:hypothetical protein
MSNDAFDKPILCTMCGRLKLSGTSSGKRSLPPKLPSISFLKQKMAIAVVQQVQSLNANAGFLST